MAGNTHSLDLEAGSSQYAAITDASQTGLDILGDLSVACWVKVESAPGLDSNYDIVSKFKASTNDRSYAFEYIDSSGTKKLQFAACADGAINTVASVAQTLNNGTYYHIAALYDASAGSVEFYVDGSSIGSAASLATSLFNGAADFRIGSLVSGGGSSTNFFDGLIDEVVVTSDLLTANEIALLKAGNDASLMATP
jgi:hypothetical protein